MPNATLIRPQNLQALTPTSLQKGTYFIQTWGCQMNEEDSEQMGLYLQSIGFKSTENLREAHIILLNTCSVRKKPEDKAFSMLGDLAILKRLRPEIVIGVCGCMAQLRAEEIHKKAKHVDFVIGTAQISKIPGLVEEILQKRNFQKRLHLPERKGAVVIDLPQRNLDHKAKLKSYVTIQYGCDKFCTFCIVPTTRGRERSRPTLEIVKEVEQLARLGTKEIMLLGQTVNSYGKNLAEGRVPFSKLLQLVAKIEGIERIRYTSPYPRDFKQDLIETIRDVPEVMEHLHMPLQAGNNDVLASMKRLYTIESFKEIIQNVRSTVPGASITTDLIVGFPGETEELFEDTLQAVREIRFDGAYMFIYSPRPGTPAEHMKNQITKEEKSRRLSKLIELQNQITLEINETYIGKDLEVLVEGPSKKDPNMLQGYSREYKMVHFPASSTELTGKIVRIIAQKAHLWGLSGKLL